MSKPLNFENKYEIDVSGGTGTASYKEISDGLTSVTPDWNYVVDQKQYHSGEGYGVSEVIGAQLILSFECDRVKGDEAQDYIAGLKGKLGGDVHTSFKWTDTEGLVYSGDVTVCNVNEGGGDMDALGTLTFELHFNGKPESAAAA